MLINNDYFKRELTVPNTDLAFSQNEENLSSFIQEKTENLLTSALGFGNFLELKSFIDADGNLRPDAPEKWQKLVHGTTFDYGGIACRWRGLIYQMGTFKFSLLAKYVYCEWQDFSTTIQSGNGEVAINSANTTAVDPTVRRVKIWNSFVEMYQGIRYYNEANLTGYLNGAFYTDWTNGRNSGEFTLIDYLVKEVNEFPNCSLTRYRLTNQYGI